MPTASRGSSARRHAKYGRGSHAIKFDSELLDSGHLVAELLKIFRSPEYQPPMLPTAGLQLMELSKKPDVSMREIQRLLETEPMLAGEVLKIAQSAGYARANPPQSLNEALVRLGLSTLTDIFFQVAMNMRVFRAPGYEPVMNELRRHSAATAILARAVGRLTPFYDEHAFLCGLLHDAGVAGVLIALGEGRKRQDVPNVELVWPVVRDAHAESTAELVRRWGLPEDVATALGSHHSLMTDGRPHPIAAIVNVADALAAEVGFGLRDEVRPESVGRAHDVLGLTPAMTKKASEHAAPFLEAVV